MFRPSPHSARTSALIMRVALVLITGCVLTNPEYDADSVGSASEGESGSLSASAGTSSDTTTTGGSASASGTSGGVSESEGGSGSTGGGGSESSTSAGLLTCADLACVTNASCHETMEGPACACDPGFDPDGELCVDIDECVDDPCAEGLCVNTPGEHQCAFPATCAELLMLLPDTVDGPATLYVGGDPQKPWTAHCHDMAGTPREYLPLPRQSGLSNTGRYTIVNPWAGYSGDRVTRFQRVRLNPANLRVDIGDMTFTSGEGAATFNNANVGYVAYGTAMTCIGGSTSAAIDLRDTAFDVQPGLFCTDGFNPNGQTQSPNARVYVNTGGGDCGWRAPSADKCPYTPINGGAAGAGEQLQLVYVGL